MSELETDSEEFDSALEDSVTDKSRDELGKDRIARLEEINTVETSLEKLETVSELELRSELTFVDSLELTSVEQGVLKFDRVSKLETTSEESNSELDVSDLLELTLDKVTVEDSLEDEDSGFKLELNDKLEALELVDSDGSGEIKISDFVEDSDFSE